MRKCEINIHFLHDNLSLKAKQNILSFSEGCDDQGDGEITPKPILLCCLVHCHDITILYLPLPHATLSLLGRKKKKRKEKEKKREEKKCLPFTSSKRNHQADRSNILSLVFPPPLATLLSFPRWHKKCQAW